MLFAVVILTSLSVSGFALQEGTITPLALQADEWECRLEGSPIVPGILSMLLSGLGQFANGDDDTAWIHLGIGIAMPTAVFAMNTFVIEDNDLRSLINYIVFPIAQLTWHAMSAFDAYGVGSEHCS
jgi:hypothetical protein